MSFIEEFNIIRVCARIYIEDFFKSGSLHIFVVGHDGSNGFQLFDFENKFFFFRIKKMWKLNSSMQHHQVAGVGDLQECSLRLCTSKLTLTSK